MEESQPQSLAPITNVRQQTLALIREQLGPWRWVVCFGSIAWLLGGLWTILAYGLRTDWFGLIPFLPVFLLTMYAEAVRRQVREAFWQQFAAARQMAYQYKGDPKAETAVMFHQGHGRKINNIITGVYNGRPLRIFSYRFTSGYDRDSETYTYTVFGFTFNGQFPHLYLNKLRNGFGTKIGEVIPLPAEFEKEFRLSAPKEYEIEALQVFTPDLLAYLLNVQLDYDIELVNQELLIFVTGQLDTLQDLEREFTGAGAIADRFASVLDIMRFTEIREHPYVLTKNHKGSHIST